MPVQHKTCFVPVSMHSCESASRCRSGQSQYVLSEKGNSLKPEEQKKWYACAKSTGELTFRKLSRKISENSTTVSDTDVLAVLNDLTKILKRHLENGEIVRFGDFGLFQIMIGSAGAEDNGKFNHSLIKTQKVIFRPGIDLK